MDTEKHLTDTRGFIHRQQAARDTWSERLAEGRCFIAADASLNDSVPWLARRYGGSEKQTCLLWGETTRIHGSAAPYCIPASTENWPELSEHLLTQQEWGIAMQLDWFCDAMTPAHQLAELVHHLRRCLLITPPHNQQGFLRLYDWRVLSSLLQVITSSQAAGLYGSLRCFFNIPPEGDIQSATLTRRPPLTSGDSPFTLSEQQWQAAAPGTFTGSRARFAAHLRRHHPRWQRADDQHLLAFIEQQCRRAQQHGLTSERDQIRWLVLCSVMPADFIDSPEAQAVLAQPQQQGTADLMDRLYQQAVSRMRQS